MGMREPNGSFRAALSHKALRLQSDERLVKLVRSGHEPAFEPIVQRYRAPLLRYAGRLVGQERAQDVVQQTFMNAFASLRDDSREIALRPWLYRITHNQAINVLEKKGSDNEPLDENLDGVPQPPDVVDQRQRLGALVRRIEELPARQRSAIVMRELEGRNYDEIAQRLDASSPMVRQLLHRARLRLRDACGLLIPLPLLRSSLAGKSSATGALQRACELGASAGTKAAPLKLGAAVLATGAIASVGIALPASGLNGRAEKKAEPPATLARTVARHGTKNAATGDQRSGGRKAGADQSPGTTARLESTPGAEAPGGQGEQQGKDEDQQPKSGDAGGGGNAPSPDPDAPVPSGSSPNPQAGTPPAQQPGGEPGQGGGTPAPPGPGSEPSGGQCPDLGPLDELVCPLLPPGA
jgi:RNA polymerase sigma factor (sigma-70 family)